MVHTPRSKRTPIVTALLVVGLTCCLAGCGGQKPKTAASGSGQSKQYLDAVKFARCMRSHGVSRFPDPTNPGGFSSAAIDSLDTSSPAFTTATTTCDRLLPNEGQPTSAEFEQAVVDGVKVARCIRAHGFSFPDPGIQGNHITLDLSNVSDSPKFEKLAQSCEDTVYGPGHG